MDNPETGDVSFAARGKTFTLRYTTAAFIALEVYLDRGVVDILDELSQWSPPFDPETRKPLPETPEALRARIKGLRAGFMRAVFWAGFHDLHRDVTIDDAGEIMTEIGGMMSVYRLVVEGIAASQNPATGESPRPPKGSGKKGRTGSAS